MSLLPLSLADQFTVADAAPRSARRAARELRTIVTGTLTAAGVATAAGVQWATRRAAGGARRRLQRLAWMPETRDDDVPDGGSADRPTR